MHQFIKDAVWIIFTLVHQCHAWCVDVQWFLIFFHHFSNSLFHRVLFLPSNLFSSDDACFDKKKYSRDIVKDGTNKGEAERPRQVIVFPVRHEVTPITQCAKNDECDCTKCTSYDQIYSSPAKDVDSVILIDAEKVHHHEYDSNEHCNKG